MAENSETVRGGRRRRRGGRRFVVPRAGATGVTPGKNHKQGDQSLSPELELTLCFYGFLKLGTEFLRNTHLF
jgi:hypothetical protein